MISKRLIGGFAALALLTGACANNDGAETAAASAEEPTAAPAAVTPAPTETGPAAFLGSTELGNILIGSDGRSLYGFTNDIDALSTCYGGCEEAWPPVIVDESWTVGPGLDLGIFATTVRDDGQLQLVAGKWPLYYYIGDEAPGEVNGQGSGDVWFAANLDGTLLLDAPAAAGQDAPAEEAAAGEDAPAEEAASVESVVSVATTDLGETLVNADGLTLYGFTQDTDGQPTCEGACADAWPPVIVDALPADLDPSVFSVATRPDGQLQLVAGVWPLYLFAGDAAPGDINGQGSGDVWFAVAPDGSLLGRNGGGAAESGSSDSGSADTGSDDSGSEGGDSDY